MAQHSLMGQGPTIIRSSLSHSVRHSTLGKTPLDKRSVQRRDLYVTLKRQTSMPPAGFETANSASEGPQTHALDCAATGVGVVTNTYE